MGLILGIIIAVCLFIMIYACLCVASEESRKEERQDMGEEDG